MNSTTATGSRRFGRALITFVGFPIGGSLARLVVGGIDSPATALAGGLLAGAAIGLTRALGS